MTSSYLQQGIQAARSGQNKKAAGLFSQAVQQSPNSALAWLCLGRVLDDPQKARYCFERAQRLDPTLLDSLNLSEMIAELAFPPAAKQESAPERTAPVVTSVEPLPEMAVNDPAPPAAAAEVTASPAGELAMDAGEEELHAEHAQALDHPAEESAPPAGEIAADQERNVFVGEIAPLASTDPQVFPLEETLPVEIPPSDPASVPLRPTSHPAQKATRKAKSSKPANLALKIILGCIGLAAVCALFFLILVIASGRMALAGRPAATFTVVPRSVLLLPTQNPSALAASTPTPTLPPEATVTPAPSLTPTVDPTQAQQNFEAQAALADGYWTSRQYHACIEAYTPLLEGRPDWTEGLFRRAVCSRLEAEQSGDLQAMNSAVTDLDRAIALDPASADAYLERGLVYRGLAEIIENSTAEKTLLFVSLENFQAGARLKPDTQEIEIEIPRTLMALDRCQEGVEEAKRLLVAVPAGSTAAIEIRRVLADGYMCLDSYTLAQIMLETNLRQAVSCEDYELQTKALIGLNSKELAYKVINNCVEESDTTNGYRYYLRAFLHYERGESDLAAMDLDVGSLLTGYRGGIYAYLRGRMALDDGSRDQGLSLLQYAEDTWRVTEGPWLKRLIRSSLANLQVPYQTPTPSQVLEVTPIP